MIGLIIFCVVFGVLSVVFAFMFFKYKSVFLKTVAMCNSDSAYDRPYYALKDEVGNELLFSPFYAQNTACAIRQVQELIENSTMFPKTLKSKDVSLYYVFTLNSKTLFLSGFDVESERPNRVKICSCDSESLKKAYEVHKEVK